MWLASDARLTPRRFWAIFALSHLIFIVILISPCDVYALLLSVSMLTYFAHMACSPPGYGHVGNTQTEGNMNVLGYAMGSVIAGRNIPAGIGSTRFMCLFALLCLDGIMGFGHRWDKLATMETVTNCRLFYVCALSLGLCALYGVWFDSVRIP